MYIMALDQGTTSSRCIIFDRSGKSCAVAQKEFRQLYPTPGWVEHDAMEIWDSIIEVAREAMRKLGVSSKEIAGIGITNQRETTVVWDKKTGKPVSNAIVWQCRRTSDMIDELIDKGHGELIKAKTGLVPDAYFSATKIKWILDNTPGAREKAQRGELLFGTIDTWLIWNLTGGAVHVTDYTNASRTMIFDIHRLCWDGQLLELLDIPSSMLPQVRSSSCVYGQSMATLFGGEIPICGAAGDQQASLFGQCCFNPGDVKNTYGTGCFLLMNTGATPVESQNGLITTIAIGMPDRIEYALEGSIFTGGAAVQWLRDELKVISSSAESQCMAESVQDSAGAYIVPAFTGLGAPYWSQHARGMLVGMTRGFSREHLVRAVLESIAYQTCDICEAMENDAKVTLTNLKVDGGAAENRFLMQFQSDMLGTQVYRPKCIETTALGAAYLAGLAVGYWKDRDDVLSNWEIDTVFTPNIDEQVYDERMKGWKRAVKCALSWAEG